MTFIAGVDQFRFNSFSNAMILQAQQEESFLRHTLTMETIEGQKRFFDALGTVSFHERLGENEPLTFSEITRDRRFISRRDFAFADRWDWRKDTDYKHFIEPNSMYMMAVSAAWGRQFDEVVIEALDGTSYSGETGATPVVFDTNMDVDIQWGEQYVIVDDGVAYGGPTSDVTMVDTGTDQGHNIGKIRQALKLLRRNNVNKNRKLYHVSHPDAIDDLLNYERAIDERKALLSRMQDVVDGLEQNFMGMEIITTTLMPQAKAFVYTDRVMVGGMGHSDMKVRLDEIPQTGHTRQLAVYGSGAATRRLEDEIVRINLDVAA